MENRVYLSLGSNIGEREKYLQEALKSLEQHPSIQIVASSSIYETEPVGYTEQPLFLNMVVEISTSLSPLDLLQYIQEIEQKLGRVREFKWGPRTIDLDILLFNQENMITEHLTIPHPRMEERAFVLIPLLEINPRLKEKITINCRLEGVRLWKQNIGVDESEHFES